VVAELVSGDEERGKKTDEDDWDDWESEVHKEARNNRSAVESLMFTLKYSHGFGRLERRGIEAVREELWKKCCPTTHVERSNCERVRKNRQP
jgi:hypothetical protein